MRPSRGLLLALAWTTAVVVFPVSTARAQEPTAELDPVRERGKAPPEALEEIVVTAERRTGLLQTTPIAVSAFTSDTMEDMRINTSADYVTLVPSFSVQESPNRVFIRGIGRVDNTLGLDPGVALYTDGLYFSEHAPLQSSSIGTERVEILRGPQGTLYGRSATGGAVNVISKRPQEEFHADAQITLANYGERAYNGLVTGPVTDWLRYLVAVYDYKSRGGIYENIAGRDFGRANGDTYEAQLEIDLTDSIELWLKYQKQVYRDSNFNGYPLTVQRTPYITDEPLLEGALTWNSAFNSPVPNPGQVSALKINHNDAIEVWCRDCYALQAHLNWDLGPVGLKYQGGFRTYDWNTYGEGDYTSRMEDELRLLLFIRQDHQYFSHELQVSSQTSGRLQWIAGLYYYNEELEQPVTINNPYNSNLQQVCLSCLSGLAWWDTSVLAPNFATSGGYFPGLLYSQVGKLKSVAWAGFGEIYYNLSDQLKLTLGLRYSRDRKHGEDYQIIRGDARAYGVDYENWFLIPDCCTWEWSTPAGLSGLRHRDRWKALSGRIVLDYTPDDDTLLYASFTQGYKPGGIRLAAVQEHASFAEESVWAYEVGFKRTFFDRLRINTAAYYYTYLDMQVLRSFVIEGTGGATNIVTDEIINAPRSRIYGLELESFLSVTPSLNVFANYSYMRGEFTRFCCSLDESYPDINGNGIPNEPEDQQDLEGRDTPQTPRHKVALGATYTWASEWGDVSLTGRWSWVDEQSYSIFAYPQDYAPSYHRTDFFLSWAKPDGRVRVVFFMKNAEDEENYNTVAHPDVNLQQSVRPNQPRRYGVDIFLSY